MNRFVFLTLLSVAALIALSCGDRPPSQAPRGETVVVAIPSDFDYLNPLLIQLAISREVCTQIFPTLVRPAFNPETGEISYTPSLATRWTFSDSGRTASFYLRSDAKWTDGKRVTARDFKFSYQLYADTLVASTRQHYLDDLVRDREGKLDFENGVEVPNDTTLILHFSRPLAPLIVLDHFYDLMPVAKHIFESIPPRELRAKVSELPVIGAGAFKVQSWKRQQELVLVSSESSVLPHPARLRELRFRIIPEPVTRLTELKTGAVDVVMAGGGIPPKDAAALAQSNPELEVRTVSNRYFDSIAWLTIDGDRYRDRKEIAPNFFFGDKRVRQAMTLAIDRQAILDGFMQGNGTVVSTSLSPAYKTFLDTSLRHDFNPDQALALLKDAGWTRGAGGLLEKDGRTFSFTLYTPTGIARRNYAATVIQQNLKDIGIDCKLEFSETIVLNKRQSEYRCDAVLWGLACETLPFQLIIWGSDFEKAPFNSSCFQHKRLDEVIAALGTPQYPHTELALWREYQRILHDEQPRTFLYFYDELEGFNKRVQNPQVTMLAILFNAAEWTVAPR